MRSDDEVLEAAVQFIINSAPRAQLIELYYWIQEHDLLRIVRCLAAAPKATREALAVFLDGVRPQHTEIEGLSNEVEFILRKQHKTTFPLMH